MGTMLNRVAKVVGESGFWRATGKLHTRLYRWTGGRLGHSSGGFTHLLLTTTGRKTGEPRTVPLTYMRDGARYVLVASNGGADRHPAWWLNLERNPRATVQVGGETHAVVAARATAEEWADLWPKVKAYNPFYGVYEQITERQIPLVVLRPVADA
jgi:deazaflavin-dependent oxidoreductase (nitroreductase family)